MGRVLIGVLAGVLGLGAVRFIGVEPARPVHYHANFAVFVDGTRLDLTADRYMEDVAACSASEDILPAQRVHLHNGDQDVVHVHHGGVTWGHLFQNLGFGLGEDYLYADDGRRWSADGERTLKFIANGFEVATLHDRMIRPGDRVLVSFGPESMAEVVASQFPQVASNAPDFDVMNDPAGCAGASAAPTFLERLRAAFWQ
ncbi:MAG TPA: hypothetical protein VNZ57_11445 [Longimicrobiales bacterium]|nr:hypothetical protein [Longimicrobiales bacterium]